MWVETKEDRSLTARERAEIVWKNYIPAAGSGIVTVGCIIGAQRAGAKKTAAAQAAIVLTERAFSEYRDKVIDQFGENADQKIRDELNQEKIEKNPPIIIAGEGVMCLEAHTGRYFLSDMETLRKACNQINAKMFGGVYAYLDDLYDILDLDYTPTSSHMGWEAGKPLELEFTAGLFRDKPVLVFNYNYLNTY